MPKEKRATRSKKNTTATSAGFSNGKLTIKVPALASRETGPLNEDLAPGRCTTREHTPKSIKKELETNQSAALDQPIALDTVDLACNSQTGTPETKPTNSGGSISSDIRFVIHTPSSFPSKRTPSHIEDPTDAKHLPKKPKTDEAGGSTKRKEASANDEESDEEKPRNFTVHVQVYETTTERQPGRGRGAKMATTTTFVSKGPFKFHTLQSFSKFKMEVSSVLSCNFSTLPVSKFEWKFEGQPQSALRKTITNQAGFDALLDAIKAKRATDNVVIWLYTPKPPMDSDEAERDPSHTSNGLMKYYPQAMPLLPGYALPPPPATPPYGYPPYYLPPYGHGPFVPGAVPYAYHQPASPGFPYRTHTCTSSPSAIFHNISLPEFCAEYGISESDQKKLAAMEYCPGHRGVERLDEKEWRDHGKFTKLGWYAFLKAHYNFCNSIKSWRV